MICFCEFPVNSGLMCSDAHFICEDDLNLYVKSESQIDDMMTLRARRARVFCPMKRLKSCNSPEFSDRDLACQVSDETFSCYLLARERLIDQDAFEAAHQSLEATLHQITQDLRTQGKCVYLSTELVTEQLRRLLPDPRQCGACGFGPVDPYACSDLQAHHGEESHLPGTHAAAINNSCPKCSWFAPNLDAWPRWAGALSSEFLAANPLDLVARRRLVLAPRTLPLPPHPQPLPSAAGYRASLLPRVGPTASASRLQGGAADAQPGSARAGRWSDVDAERWRSLRRQDRDPVLEQRPIASAPTSPGRLAGGTSLRRPAGPVDGGWETVCRRR
jgi:hypothetical protein